MPRPTTWTSSSPMSIRATARRSPPSVTSPRWPSPCSGASTRARSTIRTRSGRWPPGAWPAWGSTRRPPRTGWPTTAPTGCSPPTPTAGGWPYLEDQGIHAEVAFPGPVLAGGLSPAMYLGSQTSKGLEPVWPALHAYNRWLAEFCAAAPGPAGRVHPDRPPRHGPGRGGDRLGPLRGHLRGGHAPGHVDQVGPAGLRRRVLRAVLERLRGPRLRGQPAHRGLGHRHRRQAALRRQARRLPRALRGVRLHPPPALVHDLRRCVRPPPEAQGGGDRERRAVAALADPGHGVLLRHPRRGAGPLLSRSCARRSTSTGTCSSAGRS